MCGIVGLFLKDKLLEPKLGMMLTEMLITMSDRGPDSAGIAIYKTPSNSFTKITIQSSVPHIDFENIKVALTNFLNQNLEISRIDTHAIITIEKEYLNDVKEILFKSFPNLRIMRIGDSIELYK